MSVWICAFTCGPTDSCRTNRAETESSINRESVSRLAHMCWSVWLRNRLTELKGEEIRDGSEERRATTFRWKSCWLWENISLTACEVFRKRLKNSRQHEFVLWAERLLRPSAPDDRHEHELGSAPRPERCHGRLPGLPALAGHDSVRQPSLAPVALHTGLAVRREHNRRLHEALRRLLQQRLCQKRVQRHKRLQGRVEHVRQRQRHQRPEQLSPRSTIGLHARLASRLPRRDWRQPGKPGRRVGRWRHRERMELVSVFNHRCQRPGGCSGRNWSPSSKQSHILPVDGYRRYFHLIRFPKL